MKILAGKYLPIFGVKKINIINPTNTVAPSIPTSNNAMGQTVVINAGIWTGSPTSYTFKIYRGAILVETVTQIGSTLNYTYVQADAGNAINLKATVYASNSAGNGSSVDSNIIVQVLDVLAYNLLNAGSISDSTTISAVNFLALAGKGLAGTGVEYWSKFKIARPLVGGTSASNSYDLLNLQQCTFNGGFTFNSNGVTGNGVNGWCDENFTINTLGQNTAGVVLYCRSNAQSNNPFMKITVAPNRILDIYIAYTNGNTYASIMGGTDLPFTANSDSRGCFVFTRTSSTIYNMFIRGVKSAMSQNSIIPGTDEVTSWGEQLVSQYSSKNLSFIGYLNGSLTDAQAYAINADQITFQTMLGRNV